MIKKMYDCLIRGGMVADGSGAPAYQADVAVRDGRIEKIAPDIREPAKQVLDAAGLIVAPGFIDIHSHSDVSFLLDPRCQSKLFQGVTSELCGQCGSSPFPCPEDRLDRIRKLVSSAGNYASPSLSRFLHQVREDGREMATNLLPMVGHGSLRCGVMGYEDRPPTPEEQREMETLLERDLQAGAWGMSLGLGYTPGVSSTREELCRLGAVVGQYKGIVTAHMRYQNIRTPEALEELCAIGRYSGVQVHVAHFKASGKAAWGKAPEFMKLLREAREDGVAISADVYPYHASASGVTNSFPRWSIQGGKSRALSALSAPDSADYQRLMADLKNAFPDMAAAQNLLVAHAAACPEVNGKTLAEIASTWELEPAAALAALAQRTNASASCIRFTMHEQDVAYFLSQPDMLVGSDGRGYPLAEEENCGRPHPRNFGTFPRFLRFCREHGIPLETAVGRITGQAARLLALPERGFLWEKAWADITVFDWETIQDHATFQDPFLPNQGIIHVLVNGRVSICGGKQTDALAGRFLQKGSID